MNDRKTTTREVPSYDDGRISDNGWRNRLGEAAESIRERWPWLRVEASRGELHVGTPHPTSISGSVTLHNWRPRARVDQSPVANGSLSVARQVARDIDTVCDALDLAMSHVADVREVVPDVR